MSPPPMMQHQCPRFHLYNAPPGHTGGCPVCEAQAVELARTRGVWGVAADAEGTLEPGQTVEVVFVREGRGTTVAVQVEVR